LLKLAVKNANVDCKKLLKSLPNPNPTLVEMVEGLVIEFGTMDHKFRSHGCCFRGHVRLWGAWELLWLWQTRSFEKELFGYQCWYQAPGPWGLP